MVATSGTPLLSPEAVAVLRSQLLPLAEVVTPNLPEAEVLTGRRVVTLGDMQAAASAIFDMGARHIVVKGGHLGQGQGELAGDGRAQGHAPTDVYFDGERFVELWAERIETVHTHGTGCTFSAAIAALLARGTSVEEAVVGAKRYITGAIRHAPGLGHGHGPLGHFWQWEQQSNGEFIS
jgi:hydroxymethylpyrimidine/phosphomethylpyrimidine kinase